MAIEAKELKFLASEEKGEVSALLMRPRGAHALLVLGHGASSNMRNPFLTEVAEALAEERVATFRYQFPYMEAGGGGRNSNAVLLESVRNAVMAGRKAAKGLPVFAGGHSMSGRMTSMAAAEKPIEHLEGIIFLAFPLHPAKKRGIDRSEHLHDVTVPMLFLSGTRDALAELDLLEPVCKKLKKNATLHLVDTADHGFKILKRKRQSEEPAVKELARVASTWISGIAG